MKKEELTLLIRKLENRVQYLENKVELLELELRTHNFPQPPSIKPPYHPMYPIWCQK